MLTLAGHGVKGGKWYRNTRRDIVDGKACRLASLIVFVTYPKVSQTIFQGLGCTQLSERE